MIPPAGTDADEAMAYDLPRGSCPACGVGEVRHLVIGLPGDPDAVTNSPAWVEWVGCMHPGHDRECERCGLTWISEDPESDGSPS
ncbi:hypothetical protein GCM10009858_05240 [Terrabacter carboxydivorans]|uniref:Uncharacterized protein n=1 Tax=Terrabacter carboxydivorans TaxID=619730 RepID=A0ABN3KVM1_9MICO